jgi:hypothetical protein
MRSLDSQKKFYTCSRHFNTVLSTVRDQVIIVDGSDTQTLDLLGHFPLPSHGLTRPFNYQHICTLALPEIYSFSFFLDVKEETSSGHGPGNPHVKFKTPHQEEPRMVQASLDHQQN